MVVIATSTGRDMVEPLADRLGVDRLIATDYEEDEQGVFTGNLIGKWLWGPDKAEAVERFAEREGISLDDSYAYSDSYFDRHLLEIVGYPRAVNPDAMLRAYAVRKGWPVLGFKNREGPPQIAFEPYDLLASTRASADRAGEHRGRRRAADPAARSGDPRGEPSLAISIRSSSPASACVADASFATSARRKCSTTRCRPGDEAARTDPRRPRDRRSLPLQQGDRRAASRRGDRHLPAGHDPARRGVLRDRLRAKTGVARLAVAAERARRSRSRCGTPRRCGRATRGSRAGGAARASSGLREGRGADAR